MFLSHSEALQDKRQEMIPWGRGAHSRELTWGQLELVAEVVVISFGLSFTAAYIGFVFYFKQNN